MEVLVERAPGDPHPGGGLCRSVSKRDRAERLGLAVGESERPQRGDCELPGPSFEEQHLPAVIAAAGQNPHQHASVRAGDPPRRRCRPGGVLGGQPAVDLAGQTGCWLWAEEVAGSVGRELHTG